MTDRDKLEAVAHDAQLVTLLKQLIDSRSDLVFKALLLGIQQIVPNPPVVAPPPMVANPPISLPAPPVSGPGFGFLPGLIGALVSAWGGATGKWPMDVAMGGGLAGLGTLYAAQQNALDKFFKK